MGQCHANGEDGVECLSKPPGTQAGPPRQGLPQHATLATNLVSCKVDRIPCEPTTATTVLSHQDRPAEDTAQKVTQATSGIQPPQSPTIPHVTSEESPRGVIIIVVYPLQLPEIHLHDGWSLLSLNLALGLHLHYTEK